jgi:hypothetical protein
VLPATAQKITMAIVVRMMGVVDGPQQQAVELRLVKHTAEDFAPWYSLLVFLVMTMCPQFYFNNLPIKAAAIRPIKAVIRLRAVKCLRRNSSHSAHCCLPGV